MGMAYGKISEWLLKGYPSIHQRMSCCQPLSGAKLLPAVWWCFVGLANRFSHVPFGVMLTEISWERADKL